MARNQPALILTTIAALWPIPARAVGFGIEGGGTYTQTIHMGSPNNIWTPSGGIVIENHFPISMLFLELWGDVQTPIQIQTSTQIALTEWGASYRYVAPKYVPIDLGLRLGLNFRLLQPYVGVLGQTEVLIDSDGYRNLVNPLFGLGAVLGMDIAINAFWLGIELRAVGTVTSVWSGPTGSAFEVEPLGSIGLRL